MEWEKTGGLNLYLSHLSYLERLFYTCLRFCINDLKINIYLLYFLKLGLSVYYSFKAKPLPPPVFQAHFIVPGFLSLPLFSTEPLFPGLLVSGFVFIRDF